MVDPWRPPDDPDRPRVARTRPARTRPDPPPAPWDDEETDPGLPPVIGEDPGTLNARNPEPPRPAPKGWVKRHFRQEIP
jgi:hypothetical protein